MCVCVCVCVCACACACACACVLIFRRHLDITCRSHCRATIIACSVIGGAIVVIAVIIFVIYKRMKIKGNVKA